MTHVEMAVKQAAAEFLFVLCKESGKEGGRVRACQAMGGNIHVLTVSLVNNVPLVFEAIFPPICLK